MGQGAESWTRHAWVQVDGVTPMHGGSSVGVNTGVLFMYKEQGRNAAQEQYESIMYELHDFNEMAHIKYKNF